MEYSPLRIDIPRIPICFFVNLLFAYVYISIYIKKSKYQGMYTNMFILDLVDLGSEEEIHSARFVFSAVYGVYLIFRLFFWVSCSLDTKINRIVSDPLLLSIFSVIASPSILQNFSQSLS